MLIELLPEVELRNVVIWQVLLVVLLLSAAIIPLLGWFYCSDSICNICCNISVFVILSKPKSVFGTGNFSLFWVVFLIIYVFFFLVQSINAQSRAILMQKLDRTGTASRLFLLIGFCVTFQIMFWYWYFFHLQYCRILSSSCP